MPLIVLLALVPFAADAQTGDVPTFHTGVSDVRVVARVADGKHPVEGLTKNDFAVFDEGMVQTVDYFGHDDEPVSILLLLDVSGSMQPYLDQMASRARAALDLLRPRDRIAIMVFGKRSEIHQDFSDNIAESARQIALAVRGHDVGAETAINSALMDAAGYMRAHSPPDSGRRAILIVTDNLCLNYRLTDRQVIRELYSTDAVLDAIVIGRGIRPAPPKPGQAFNADVSPADVFHIAEETGGQAILAGDSKDTLRDLVEAIRARYTLAYHAPQATPGSFRHIQVMLTPAARTRYPNAVLQCRTGYYVPR